MTRKSLRRRATEREWWWKFPQKAQRVSPRSSGLNTTVIRPAGALAEKRGTDISAAFSAAYSDERMPYRGVNLGGTAKQLSS